MMANHKSTHRPSPYLREPPLGHFPKIFEIDNFSEDPANVNSDWAPGPPLPSGPESQGLSVGPTRLWAFFPSYVFKVLSPLGLFPHVSKLRTLPCTQNIMKKYHAIDVSTSLPTF